MDVNGPIRSAELREVYYQGAPAPKKKFNKEELRKQLEKKRDRDQTPIVGIFENKETPGGGVSFGLKLYPGESFKFWSFMDGERYSIPRGVVNHLNNDCFYYEYRHLNGESGDQGIRLAHNDGRLGNQHMQIKRKVHRFRFNVLDFTDDDLEIRQSDLLEVETKI